VIFIGAGDGTFVQHATVGTGAGSQPSGFARGDFNRDGKIDLAVPLALTNQVEILFGDGMAGFPTTTMSTVCSSPKAIVGGAFNASTDTHDDLAIVCSTGDEILVMLGDGSGAFPTQHMVSTGTGSAPTAIATADFNRDGNPDFASANFRTANASVTRGDGNGNFAAAQAVSAGMHPQSVAAADVDGDGHVDLVVADSLSESTIEVLHGDGAGGFATAMVYTVGAEPDAVGAYDLNNDGVNDVVVANSASDNVTVILGPL
jgi:hypothetical protein